jgi:hypothetical protein
VSISRRSVVGEDKSLFLLRESSVLKLGVLGELLSFENEKVINRERRICENIGRAHCCYEKHG